MSLYMSINIRIHNFISEANMIQQNTSNKIPNAWHKTKLKEELD